MSESLFNPQGRSWWSGNLYGKKETMIANVRGCLRRAVAQAWSHLTSGTHWEAGRSSLSHSTEHQVWKRKQTALGHKEQLRASSLCTALHFNILCMSTPHTDDGALVLCGTLTLVCQARIGTQLERLWWKTVSALQLLSERCSYFCSLEISKGRQQLQTLARF